MKKAIVLLLALVMIVCALSAAVGDASNVTVGDTITFGRYPQTRKSDDMTPIEWIVLDVRGKKALLLSRYGLDGKYYNDNGGDITWGKSTLRTRLNDDFLNRAFSAEEQSAILITEVDNSSGQGYKKWKTKGGKNTKDRIFLLSYAEANRYLGVTFEDYNNVGARVAPTGYAIAQGWFVNMSDNFQTADGEPAMWWWLRSPGNKQDYAAIVVNSGTLRSRLVSNEKGVVRPALWVDLSLIE